MQLISFSSYIGSIYSCCIYFIILWGIKYSQRVAVIASNVNDFLQDSAKAYSVLMSYLNLVLFDRDGRGCATVSRQLLSPLLADSLVGLYAEHRPEQLTNFLLHSWVKNYSPGTDKLYCGKTCVDCCFFSFVCREGIGTTEQKIT